MSETKTLKEAMAAVYINPVQAKALEAFGYCIVPIKATDEMECAITDPDDCATPDAARCVWRDMLAARPKLNDAE